MQSGDTKNRIQADVCDYETRVVIVGAGLAGLAAAQRLRESDLDDFMLIEAQDRVGGRVHTVDFSDFVLELVSSLCKTNNSNLISFALSSNTLESFHWD